MLAEYTEEDSDGRFRLLELRNRNSAFNPTTRPNLYFPIYVDPDSNAVALERDATFSEEALPLDSNGQPTCWTWSPPKILADKKLLVARKTADRSWRVFRKDYLRNENGDEATTKPKTVWLESDLNMDLARKTLTDVMGRNAFDFPKPVALIQRLIELIPKDDAIVLDSFAGSGTTAHAVLAQNAKDGGNRKFVLVEGEDYADTLTAERVRRVINGYSFEGTQKEELLRESITWSAFSRDMATNTPFDGYRDAMAEARFRTEVASGRIQFRLRTDTYNWKMPDTTITYEPEGAQQLVGSNGAALARSLFSPIYRGDFSDGEERDVAVYLDEQQALHWWHRNVARQSYSVQGWRRDKVYPDLLFALQRTGKGDRVIALEMKGEHLAGNDKTEYVQKLLRLLSDNYAFERVGGLELVADDGTQMAADLVLMDDWKTRIPNEFLG